MTSQVGVLRTCPQTVVEDYGRLLRLVKYDQVLPRDRDLILKLNLSWTKYFPACSTQPWQLDGVLATLLADGYDRRRIHPVENKTVVTDPVQGCHNNKWFPVLERYGLPFIPLPDVEWTVYRFKTPLLKLNEIFPEGIEIPKMYIGKSVCHLPTVKCVHPDTEIQLADGSLVPAEMLVKELHVREDPVVLPDGDRVSEGEVRVVSLGPTGLEGGHATHFWRTPVNDEPVWTVRTRTGRGVTTSARHPFLTPEGWTPASALRVGDRIAIARHVRIEGRSQPLPAVARLGHNEIDVGRLALKPGRRYDVAVQRGIIRDYVAGRPTTAIARDLGTHPEAIRSVIRRYGLQLRWRRVWARVPERTSPEFWRWFGYFTAEGYAYEVSGTYRISFTNSDPDIRDDYVGLVRTLFGVEPRIRRGGEIYFDGLNLRPFFESLGWPTPTSAGSKSVPESLFKCPDLEIAAFLSGYLDGDGSVGKGIVRVTTKSRRLAFQVQMLLSRLGVVAVLAPIHSLATKTMTEKRQYFELRIFGDDVVSLANFVRFRCRRKHQRLEVICARRSSPTRSPKWDTIPVPGRLLRLVREGLRLPKSGSGQPCMKALEAGKAEPARTTVRRLIELFGARDSKGHFRSEIEYMAFLASNDIAWDHVVAIEQHPADVPFFYDLSVDGPSCFIGNGLSLHNTHGHALTTGAIKNSFGGLLKEVRHYAHEFMHEVLVDLMLMQRELHPSVFAVMDGTVMGDGAGPRTMVPREGNLILASADQVAIDAIAARIMGFDPLAIPYLRMCHERGLGIADPRRIEVVGDAEAADVNMGFRTRRSLVIWGDQLIRKGPLRPLKRLLLHSPLVVWAPFASNVYHDLLWYPTVGQARIRAFSRTPWGRLFASY